MKRLTSDYENIATGYAVNAIEKRTNVETWIDLAKAGVYAVLTVASAVERVAKALEKQR